MDPADQKQEQERYWAGARRSRTRDLYRLTPLRRARRSVDAVLRRLLYGLLRLLFRPASFEGPIDVMALESLLIMPYGDALGDLVVASPVWRAIKRRNPACRIGVIVSGRNAGIVAEDPDIDDRYFIEGRLGTKHLGELRRARRAGYQVALNLHFAKLTDQGLLTALVAPRALKLTGHHPRAEQYRFFFDHIGRRERHTTHLSVHSLELLSEVVTFTPPLKTREAWPTLVLSDERRVAVRAELQGLGVHGRFVVIHQQAATPFREWGIENTLELSARLLQYDPSLSIILTATTLLEPRLREALHSADPRILLFPASMDLLRLSALLAEAALVITPETSIPHLATALGRPVLELLPDRDAVPVEWLPIGVPSRLLAPERHGMPVATIPVAAVFEAACALLAVGPPLPSQTSLEVGAPALMYQAASGEAPLVTFLHDRI